MRRLAILSLLLCGSVQAQIQLMSQEKLAALRASLPATESDRWQDFFNDPNTVFYTAAEMPPAYQHADAGLLVNGMLRGVNATSQATTFHWVLNNISGDNLERQKPDGYGGNANIEFPWRHGVAGGTDSSEGIATTFKMMRLPRRENGSVWPVVWWRDVLGGSRVGPHLCYLWIFPKGTEFAEVLGMRDSKNVMHTWEVRIRIRERDYWDVDKLNPFVTSEDLAKRLAAEGRQEIAAKLTVERPVKSERLFDSLHRKPAFDQLGGEDVLPPLGEELAAYLLDSTPFKSSVGARWHRGTNGIDAAAPTAKERFSIVPPDYQGTFIGNDPESCRNCHKHTLHHVDEFDSVRQWYGRVRGSRDEIISWNPVEPSSVSPNGAARQVVMRRAFVEAGMLEQFDKSRHPPEMYSLLSK